MNISAALSLSDAFTSVDGVCTYKGVTSLEAVKVSGDANVPSGCVTWRTRELPSVGGPTVFAQVNGRSNPRDPNGFRWIPGELLVEAEDRIRVSIFFSPQATHSGTFHKHTAGEGDSNPSESQPSTRTHNEAEGVRKFGRAPRRRIGRT